MANIQVKQGSATSQRPDKNGVVIAHIVNDVGGWGKGFVLAIDELSAIPQAAYRALAKDFAGLIPVPHLQFVEVTPGLFIANMVAQRGIQKASSGQILVDYEALKKCLAATFKRAISLNYHVHMPAGMGSGLAGGDKATIHKMICSTAEEVEKQSPAAQKLGRSLTIVLWEFADQNARSFVEQRQSGTPTASSAGTETVENTADDGQPTLTADPDDMADLG